MEASIHRGFLIPHRPNMQHLPTGPAHAIELRLVNRTTGAKEWHRLYKKPEVGLTLRGFDLANRDLLGYGLGLAGYFSAPIILTDRFRWNLELAMGMGLVTKPFDYETNYKNIAIGSYLNIFTFAANHWSYRVTEQFHLIAHLSFNHFSNAAVTVPNQGINYPMIGLGGSWIPPAPEVSTSAQVEGDKTEKIPHHWQVAFGTGFRETSRPREKKFPAFSLVGDRMWGLNQKSVVMTGIDVLYNAVLINKRSEKGLEEVTPLENVQLGVHVGYRLHISKLAMFAAMGLYVIDTYKQDGLVYHRAGFQYFFRERWAANITIKTHYLTADFFELGFAHRF